MSSSDLSDSEWTNTRSSPKRIANVVSRFDAAKRKLVEDICFKGMLKVPPIKYLDRKFTMSLLNKIDTKKRAIRVNEHKFIELCAKDVHHYLDIPLGPNKLFGLEDRSETEKMDFIRFGIGSSRADIDEKNSLKAAEDIILAEYPNEMSQYQSDQFKVSFVCYAMGHFLMAKYSYNHGIKDFWGSLLKTSEIHSFNFCQAVVDELIECARHVQKESKANRPIKNISGCHLFLQAKYLDSINLGILTITNSGIPRIEVFTSLVIEKMITAIHPTGNSSDGYDTPTTGIQKPPKVISGLNRMASISKTKPAPTILTNIEVSIPKPASTAYLAAYTSGNIDRRLNDKQIDDLRLHNARMKLFMNNFKTKSSVDLQGFFLANPGSKEMFHSSVDQLMNQVLDQVLVLSKSLHEHTEVFNRPTFKSPSFYTSAKRTSVKSICGYESSTDCSTIKKSKTEHFLTGKNLLPDLTNVAGASSPQLDRPQNSLEGFVTPEYNMMKNNQIPSYSDKSTSGLDGLTFSNIMAPSPTSSNTSTAGVSTGKDKTPSELLPSSAKSHEAQQVQFVAQRQPINIQYKHGIHITEDPSDADHIDSPISKIAVNKGKMARNPWLYGAPTNVVNKDAADTLFNWLSVTKSATLDSIWINHSDPKIIIIAGNDFKSVFTRGFNFTSDLFDLGVRRFYQMDRSTYGVGSKLRWMHPFESDFARKVLNDEPILTSRSVRIQLLGNSEEYEISNCRMISVPNLSGETWTSYFWDMKESLVHVVDPTFENSRASELHDIHAPIVDKLQASLSRSLAQAYEGWEIDWTIWKKNYIQPFLPGKKSNESGMLTLLALRKFNGKKFELPQTQGSLNSFAKQLLHNMLSIEGNKGVLPDVFVNSID